MTKLIIAITAATPFAPRPLLVKGCIRGALAGGVAGHYAHHHAIAGAVAGCAAGHYYYKHKVQLRHGPHQPPPRLRWRPSCIESILQASNDFKVQDWVTTALVTLGREAWL